MGSEFIGFRSGMYGIFDEIRGAGDGNTQSFTGQSRFVVQRPVMYIREYQATARSRFIAAQLFFIFLKIKSNG